jgi:signal transduction histidine kinase
MARKPDFLLNLIREYLDLARFEGGERTFHPKASVDLVKDVVEPALVTCDPDLLKIVAVIFAGNAVKYGRDSGIVRVSVPRSQTAPAGFGP